MELAAIWLLDARRLDLIVAHKILDLTPESCRVAVKGCGLLGGCSSIAGDLPAGNALVRLLRSGKGDRGGGSSPVCQPACEAHP